MYERIGGEGFEIIAVAEDTEGEAAAGRFYDAANATFTTLIDQKHTLSSLYGMVNVPTAVWVDEQGKVVRFDEGAYSKKYQAGSLSYGTDTYVPMLEDWVEHGAASRYVQEPDQLSSLVAQRTENQAKADAAFRLGSFFELSGDKERATRYWQQAQELHPESWNYHRQEWSYTPGDAVRKWLEKVRAQGDKPYYEPMSLPDGEPPADPPEG